MFSDVIVTSHSSCVFLSSANISPVRFVLHLQDWWCAGKRETSFPVNKLWLIYLPPSLWPVTMTEVEFHIRVQVEFHIFNVLSPNILLPAWLVYETKDVLHLSQWFFQYRMKGVTNRIVSIELKKLLITAAFSLLRTEEPCEQCACLNCPIP